MESKYLIEIYPNKGESKKDFIKRFMKVTKDEYPNVKQRFAVANSYWDRRNKKKSNEALIEATLAQILNKSRSADAYKDEAKGDRWARRANVEIKDENSPYRNINMDNLWKKDLLIIEFPIEGETASYRVTLSLDKVLDKIKDEVKENKNSLTLPLIKQGIQEAIKSSDMRINCTCPDYRYRLAYFNSKNKINHGKDETRPSDITNPTDSKGAGCKHTLKVLADNSIVDATADILFKYINYCKSKMQYNYLKFIFPKLFGMDSKEAEKIVQDKKNAEKEDSINLSKALNRATFS